MLLLLLDRQFQDITDWDPVINITVVVLLIVGVAFLLFLVVSRAAKRRRFRNRVARAGRRPKQPGETRGE